MMNLPAPETVAAAIIETAKVEILPRFRSLQDHEINEKSPGDLVTVADLEAEKALNKSLSALLPGSIMVGEEAVAADPGLLAALDGPGPSWLIDPIDGTINFAHGVPLFATMVALVIGGEVVGGWVYDPVHDVMAMAEKGSGASLDGDMAAMPAPPALNRLSGCLHLSGYDRDLAATAARNFDAVGPLLVLHCAGLEYQMMLKGRLHYALYLRTNPWDHAAGQCILSEAGGYTARLDGSPYGIDIVDHPSPLLAAAGQGAWQELRQELFGLTDKP